MSGSSGSLVRSGILQRDKVFVCFDALFRAGFSSVKHYFDLFREKPAPEIIIRDSFRILTPVAFHVYDGDRNGGTCAVGIRKIDPGEYLHQRIRYPARRERGFGLFPLRSGESARPAERRGRRNARRFTDGPTGPAEES